MKNDQWNVARKQARKIKEKELNKETKKELSKVRKWGKDERKKTGKAPMESKEREKGVGGGKEGQEKVWIFVTHVWSMWTLSLHKNE